MSRRLPWTHEELSAMLQSTREHIARTEAAYPEARELPLLTEDEARDLLFFLVATGRERILTEAECFLYGQLLAAYKMAIMAQKLGHADGRYYVISEAEIVKVARSKEG